MDCKKMAAKLYEFLDSEMDDKQRLEFQSHLAACEKCFDRVEFEKLLRLTVQKGISCTMPKGLRDKVHSAIHLASQKKSAKPAPKKA